MPTVRTTGKSGPWRAALERRREASQRRGCPAPGTRGRTSGLLAARAKALGLAPPEPHLPGVVPPHCKPSRLTMNQVQYLVVGRALAPARAAFAARNAERIAAEQSALFGDHAASLAAFERSSPASD